MSRKKARVHSKNHALIGRLITESYSVKSEVSLSDALEFRRDQYGLSAAEFSMVLGILPTNYSAVISGKRRLPLDAVKRAFGIGVPATVLLQFDELEETP